MSHTLQLIDSARFMASSLSNFVDKLSEGIHGMELNVNMDITIKM